ncbi:hypothetical protein EIP91_005307 [Steccherinum ochraceum]|uniref:WD40 repeat-like protein n=1 Tax=Steccherinum ochraceum TaxID=92696 RepID=A0A4V2MVU1_9APHY|nr:hypothetical protein EIP91_005307 [Steccherinum ochraceum]
MLAVSTTDALVVLDPKKASSSSTSPSPACKLSSPTALVWSQDNSVLFVSHSSGIQKLDSQGNALSTICEPSEPPTTLLVKDKGNTLVYSFANEVFLVDIASGQVAHKLTTTHKSPISSLTLSSDGTLLASISPETAQVHNLSLGTNTSLRGLPISAGPVTACAFHPHTRTRLLLGIGNLLAIYETTRPSGPARVVTMEKEKDGMAVGKVVAITSSPFSKSLVAVAFSGGVVGLVDLEKEKGLFRTLSLSIPLSSLLFSPEGAALYAGTENGKVLVLDLRSLDKPPKTIVVCQDGQSVTAMSVQRKLKVGESKARSAATKTSTPPEVIRTTVRRAASSSNTLAVPNKKATSTRSKPLAASTAGTPIRIRTSTTSTTTTPVRSRVTSTATVTQPTPSPRPGIRTRTISTITSPNVKTPPACWSSKASYRCWEGFWHLSWDETHNEKSDRLDVSVSIDNLLDLPKPRKENLSPQGTRQRTVSSLSATSTRTTRTRTISTTSQRSTASSRMTGSTMGTSVSGASSISRTATARPSKYSTSAAAVAAGKSQPALRKGSKEWAAESMSPIPPVPPLPLTFGEPEQLTLVLCPVPRDRTPSPELPFTDKVPVTPLPPSRAAKGKAPERHLGVLGLGTPEVERWIAAGENEKREGRKVGFAEDGSPRAKSPLIEHDEHDDDDDDDEPQEAKIEMTVQISPRRPPTTSSTAWAPIPSPLRNPLGGQSPAAVPGPSTNPAQDLLSTLIRDALYDFRRETKAEIVGLHLDLVNMGRGWRKEMKDAMDQWGQELNEVRDENKRLKEENERLRKRAAY